VIIVVQESDVGEIFYIESGFGRHLALFVQSPVGSRCDVRERALAMMRFCLNKKQLNGRCHEHDIDGATIDDKYHWQVCPFFYIYGHK
jgi:hypothetical protein